MIRVTKEEGHYTLKRVQKLPPKGNSNLLYAFIGPTIDKLYRWLPNGEYEEICLGAGSSIFEATGLTFDASTNILTSTFADGSDRSVSLTSLFSQTNLSFNPSSGDIDIVFADGSTGNINLYQNTTNVEFDQQTGDLSVTFLNGSTNTVNIDIPKNTSDLTNDGENGSDPFITEKDLAQYTLSPISGTNEVNLLRDGSVVSTINLTPYLDDTNLARIVSGTLDSNGVATFTRDDDTTFTVDFGPLLNAITASNGLTKVGDDIQLGGVLDKDTILDLNENTLRFSVSGASPSDQFIMNSAATFLRSPGFVNFSAGDNMEIASPQILLSIPDGSGGDLRIRPGNQISTDTSQDGYVLTKANQDGVVEWQPSGGDPEGLEQLDEGNGIGWRLVQPTPITNGSTFASLGFNATDLTRSQTSFFTNIGASGDYSFSGGDRNQAFGLASVALGERNNITGDHSVGIGIGNIVSDDRSTAFGSFNNVTAGSAFSAGAQNNSSGLGSVTFGTNNTALGERSFASGFFNTASGANEFVIGEYSTTYTPSGSGTDRLFNIGNGDFGATSDAFSVRKEGTVFAPSLTNTLIDNATGDVLITKDWFNANNSSGGGTTTINRTGSIPSTNNNFDIVLGGSGVGNVTLVKPTGLERLNEGNGLGHRLIGRVASNYGPIGNFSVDLSLSSSTSSVLGATGEISFATGFENIASGQYSSVKGLRNESSGFGSDSKGADNVASGALSDAKGVNNIVSSYWASVSGVRNFSRSVAETAIGLYGTDYTPINTDSDLPSDHSNGLTDRVFNVGNGTDITNRSNAFTIYKNGAIQLYPVPQSSITNAQTGMLIMDSADSNKLKIHVGGVWREIQLV